MEEEREESAKHIQRLNFLFFLVFLLFVLLILRLAFIQLVEGERYVKASEEISFRPIYITAPRGWILDRNGEVLVSNKPVYAITFLEENHRKEDLLRIAERLEKLLMPIDTTYDRRKILQKMDAGLRFQFDGNRWILVESPRSMPSYYPRRIIEDVPKEVMFYIEEHRNELPGVNVSVEPMREYKKGEFATHILGYTNAIPPSQLESYLAKGYRPDDRVGVSGLEQYYEPQLKGRHGVRQVRINNLAKLVESKDLEAPMRGNDLVLTIDWRFQQKVEQILKEELEHLRTRKKDPIPHVNQAIAIVLNPHTGEIYALANIPQYDLNIHQSPDFGERYLKEVAGRELNLAIQGYYQPGSTIKMATVLLGLEKGLITEKEKIYSSGKYEVGTSIKRDWLKWGHGWVDARKALMESVNTYMYEIGMRLAKYPQSKTLFREKFAEIDRFYQQFGLGQKTGIDLPGEKSAWRSSEKQLGRLADAMIGQYHAYTPIQLAQYVSMIANGGYRIRPYLVKEIRKPREEFQTAGQVLMIREPEVLSIADVKAKNLKVVQEGMLAVTTNPRGTAYKAFTGFPYKVAAKTGTVQKAIGQNDALIVGYAPYENPEVAFVVVVPKGGGGSDAAGPIARRILDAYYGFPSANRVK